jgi:hypothetical protein
MVPFTLSMEIVGGKETVGLLPWVTYKTLIGKEHWSDCIDNQNEFYSNFEMLHKIKSTIISNCISCFKKVETLLGQMFLDILYFLLFKILV